MSEDRRKYDDELKVAIREVKEETSKIWKLLNGNGTEGLVAKVNRHDTHLLTVQGYVRSAVTALIVGIIGVALAYAVVKFGIPQ